MQKPPANILKYGRSETLPEWVEFRAGDLSLVYGHGFIRYLKIGEVEVLRMINHLVRDKNWNTIPQTIFNEKISSSNQSFSIQYDCRAQTEEVDFVWRCEVEGTPDNRITFSINGKALKPFKRNRVGFTVLHPNGECQGKPVTIWHSDGSSETSEFPRLVSPHQPFTDIQAMQWEVGSSQARLEFSGDIFETEDQRNWTDDSYKTYCTPLALPFPHLLQTGDTVEQKIELHIIGYKPPSTTKGHPHRYYFEVLPQEHKLPQIGVARSTEVDQLTEDQLKWLEALNLDHYQVDLNLYQLQWESILERAVDESIRLGTTLELSLFFRNTKREIDKFIEVAARFKAHIGIVNIFDHRSHYTSEETLNHAVNNLKAVFTKASVGAGTNAFFTELNRNRVNHESLDHLVYSVNPQVHAFDNESLVESLNAQPDTVHTALSFSEGRPVHISPVTLKMRWNPNATETDKSWWERTDPRQMSLFGAGWLLGSVQNLVSCDLKAVTYFETVGKNGILQDKRLFPTYFVLRYLLERKQQVFRTISSSHPLSFGGLVNGQNELVLVNYTNGTVTVELPPGYKQVDARSIDQQNIWELMTGQIELDQLPVHHFSNAVLLNPFALAFLRI